MHVISRVGKVAFPAALAVAAVWTAEAQAQPVGSDFYTVPPCRVVDTRLEPGPRGGPALVAGASRDFSVKGVCGIPASALAITANVTVVAPSTAGHLRLFASGAPSPETSTLNFGAGVTRAVNAIVSLGIGGAISVVADQASGSAQLVVDVVGFFATAGCAPTRLPERPSTTINTGTRTLSWPDVPGATSYNVYVRTLPGSCGLVPNNVSVTRADLAIAGATSPVDVSSYNKCGVCNWVDVTAVSGLCESPLWSDFAADAPMGFSLLPCVP